MQSKNLWHIKSSAYFSGLTDPSEQIQRTRHTVSQQMNRSLSNEQRIQIESVDAFNWQRAHLRNKYCFFFIANDSP